MALDHLHELVGLLSRRTQSRKRRHRGCRDSEVTPSKGSCLKTSPRVISHLSCGRPVRAHGWSSRRLYLVEEGGWGGKGQRVDGTSRRRPRNMRTTAEKGTSSSIRSRTNVLIDLLPHYRPENSTFSWPDGAARRPRRCCWVSDEFVLVTSGLELGHLEGSDLWIRELDFFFWISVLSIR